MPTRPPTFRVKRQRTNAEVNAESDRRRGSARSRGYSAQWDSEAAAFKRVHPLCMGCKAIGLVKVTDVVDHVVPHRGNMAIFWDRDRWQPSCRWHHDVIKQKLEAQYERGAVKMDDLWLNSAVAMKLSRECLLRD